jgi:phosphomannomutase
MKGGVSITASHNPIEWNGLKFFTSAGTVLNAPKFEELLKVYNERRFRYASWDGFHKVAAETDAVDIHIAKVLDCDFVSAEQIRGRGFRVACDCFHGAGGVAVPKLLEQLGCTVFSMGCEMDGVFQGDPEPRSENLKALGDLVRKNKCDLGIAVDPDVDRLALVDAEGEPVTEELTLALAIKLVTSHKRGPVVANLSTSLMSYDAAHSNGCEYFRSKIGEINVVDKMLEVGAVIGGEGNGGVILPDVQPGRDAITGIALVLQLMTEQQATLRALKESFPSYYLHKQKLPLTGIDLSNLSDVLKKHFSGWEFNESDGYHVSRDGQWFQLRASNTEPIIRLFVETTSRKDSEALAVRVHEIARSG